MSENISKKLSIVSFLFLFAMAVFLVGYKVGKSKLWPHQLIDDMQHTIHSLLEFGAIVQTNRLIEAQPHFSRERFKIYNQQEIFPGYYALMGFDGAANKYSAWLMDVNGQTLHTWDIDYAHLSNDESGKFTSPHAFKILHDGSLIVSFDSGNLMARIDQCSQPMWVKEGVFHHSIERAPDGSYWAWRGQHGAYGHYNYLTNFDPESGKTIREIGLVEDIIKKSYDNALHFSLRDDYPFQEFGPEVEKTVSDIFHPNDIDILSVELADKFPMFKAGDLLISLRNTSLVAVIDPDTLEVKWSGNGPWRFQHDPDFVADGSISIYDNNTDLKRSEILKVDPVTNKTWNELKGGDLHFYSQTQGKHQYLENGNIFLVMPDEGRAAEVTASGDMVFEYNNISSFTEKYNEHLANGLWMPGDYFTSVPACSGSNKE